MKLKEAKQILMNDNDTFQRYTVKERHQAVKLGIEALDRIRYGRMHPETTITDLLLGETT